MCVVGLVRPGGPLLRLAVGHDRVCGEPSVRQVVGDCTVCGAAQSWAPAVHIAGKTPWSRSAARGDGCVAERFCLVFVSYRCMTRVTRRDALCVRVLRPQCIHVPYRRTLLVASESRDLLVCPPVRAAVTIHSFIQALRITREQAALLRACGRSLVRAVLMA